MEFLGLTIVFYEATPPGIGYFILSISIDFPEHPVFLNRNIIWMKNDGWWKFRMGAVLLY